MNGRRWEVGTDGRPARGERSGKLGLFPGSLQIISELGCDAPCGTVNIAIDEDVGNLRRGVCNALVYIGKMNSPYRESVVYKRCSWVLSPTLLTYYVKLSFISDYRKALN
jgi:hypothetical protein